MDVIIILIMGIAGSKGCIFACPPPKKTFYERFIVQNSQVKKKIKCASPCVWEVKRQTLSNYQHNTSEVMPLKTYYRSPTLQRQAVTSHHRWPCASQSSWHCCHLNLHVIPHHKDIYWEAPMARAAACRMRWLEKEPFQLQRNKHFFFHLKNSLLHQHCKNVFFMWHKKGKKGITVDTRGD